jgi:opacity protein-like surface antigen
MSRIKMAATVTALAVLVLLSPRLVEAQQPESRFRVSFAPAATTVGGDAELALGGTVGYRFSEHLWFEGDLTWIDAAAGGFSDRRLAFDADSLNTSGLAELARRQLTFFGRGRPGGLPFPILPNLPVNIGQLRAEADGSTVVGTLGLRYELPVQTARFRPYVSGGLGINNTVQEFHLDPTALTPAIDDSTSHTGYAFGAGAGASVRLAGQFWVEGDARYLRLSRDRDIMRLGGGVSLRF